MSDLTAYLLKCADDSYDVAPAEVNPDRLREAADEIVHLRAEIKRLRGWDNTIDAMQQSHDAMRTALGRISALNPPPSDWLRGAAAVLLEAQDIARKALGGTQ